MTDTTHSMSEVVSEETRAPHDWHSDESRLRVRRRYAAERRFKFWGLGAVMVALAILAFLMVAIVGNGYKAFLQTQVKLTINFEASSIGLPENPTEADYRTADYMALVKESLRQKFPEVKGRRDKRTLYGLVSSGAAEQLRQIVMEDPTVLGQVKDVWLLASDDVDMFFKGNIPQDLPEDLRRVKDNEIFWIRKLEREESMVTRFNSTFFTASDSREPELAGIRGALMGSIFTLFVTLLISFPIGVATAVYLEEFAPKNKWTDMIEVNINNLAAVPSIVFGLLGLSVFLNVMHLPRSAPVVGGLTLALMTLPTIIISARAALKSIPPSIRDAALGLGASRLQAVTDHVLPLSMPGILTGTIIGMAQALGETAPLLMIGMVAFIVDIPTSPMDASTVLPVQIYIWADSPERAFVERVSAAIMVLLGVLVSMNALAVYLRKRFERKW